MDLQAFIQRCEEWDKNGTPALGLAACDAVLEAGAQGRLLINALRYKAVFLLQASDGWSLEVVGCLKEALGAASAFPEEKPAILHTLVAAYSTAGAYEDAQTYADEFFRLVGNTPAEHLRHRVPKVWFALGYAYEIGRNYEKAAETYQRALEESRPIPEQYNPGRAEHNLVHVYLELGNIDDAYRMLQESQAHLDFAEFGSYMKNQEARCLLAMGRLSEAEAACQAALAHPSCSDEVRAEVLLTQSQILMEAGLLHEAKELANQALSMAIRLSNRRLVRKSEGFLAALQHREEVPQP